MNQVDSIFVTTAGNALKQFCTGNNVVCFIPNPSDLSVENYNNSKKTEFEVDLLFVELERNLTIDIHSSNIWTMELAGS